ncbi:12485_t:CDS:1, partial [Ambispora leptoticha]
MGEHGDIQLRTLHSLIWKRYCEINSYKCWSTSGKWNHQLCLDLDNVKVVIKPPADLDNDSRDLSSSRIKLINRTVF